MDKLVIKTAVPFGYLIIAVIFSVSFLLSLAITFRAIRAVPVKKFQLAISLSSIGFLSLVFWTNISQDDIDLNPIIVGNTPLAGIWENGDSKLTLLSDGKYLCTGTLCDEINMNGQWERHRDFEVDLRSANSTTVRWRITKNVSKHRYELLAGASGDPDLWETRVTFTKKVAPE